MPLALGATPTPLPPDGVDDDGGRSDEEEEGNGDATGAG